MAKQNINVGTAANDKKGDSLRAAFQKVNANFTELYTELGLVVDANLNLGAFEFAGSTLSTTDSTAIVIDQAVTVSSNLTVGGDVLPSVTNGGDLGSAARPWRSLYVSNNTIYIGGVPLGIDANGNLTVDGSLITGGGGGGSTLVNGNKTVSLGTDGLLTLPLQGKIGPGNDANSFLTFNYGDDVTLSAGDTLALNGYGHIVLTTGLIGAGPQRYSWDFGVDGVLTLPNGSTIGDGEAGVGVPITTARGTILLGNLAECAGGESHFHIMKAGQQAIDLFLGDDSNYVKLPDTGGVEIATQNFNQYSWTFGTDGDLEIPGDIKSNGNINIDINLADSTLRRWQFGEDGDLILPAGGDIKNSTGTSVLGGAAGPVQTHLELTQSPFMVLGVILGTPVSFTRTAEGSQTDAIAPGLRLARGAIGALYNAEVEQSYDRNTHAQPTGTAWNADGWGNLVGLATRTYTTFYEALNGAVGNNIIGAELVMHDTINDRYYKFSFSNWGGDNGGSFAYTRTLIEDPNYFRKLDYATANNVDVIEDDSTLQIGITRDNNGGIYNPFTEEGWDEDVSPDGTEWNIDGWDDLTDVETRTYTNFYDVYDEAIGNNILGSKAVMYVPSIDKYYAIQWLSWTQNNAGGGFSYLRYEIDLDKLDEGVRFADGTVQKTAYIPTNVKLTAPNKRRIEEVAGYKSVSVTERMLRNLTTTASRNYDDNSIIWFDRTTTTIDEILNDRDAAGIIDNTTVQFSLDNTNWYTLSGGEFSNGDEKGYSVTLNGATLTYDQGDTVYFRYVGGGGPVVWWDKEDLPGGSGYFRGAVIDYHAYTDDATIIGTIHIVDDDGEENITHTEVSSGSTDSENDDLWLVTDEGTISYRRLDGEANTLKIQWTAKVFYGSENN